ncbi:MAG: ROK family protein [Clostridia bacterium]
MYYIGIDIGGMSVKGGLVDATGKIYVKDSFKTNPTEDPTVMIADIAKLCRSLSEKSGVKLEDIKGVGIGVPGTINNQTGVITYANNINFENVPIVAELKKHISLPVQIGNDANCAALGEVAFGSAKGMDNIIFVTLGTGVGSGIILDGKIFEGQGGAGAEAGHMCLVLGGELCTCGKRGCWEAYASATALIRQTKRAAEKYPNSLLAKTIAEEGKVSGRTAFVAARANDPAGKAVVKRYVRYIAEGLVSLVNIFRPTALIIGGGISNEGDYLIKRLQRLVSYYSYGGKRNPDVKVIKAELLNDAGILGAAALLLK